MKKGAKVFVVLAIIVALILVWFLASPLFINKVVNEEIPTNTGVLSNSTEMILLSGEFQDADSFHKVSGVAKIIDSGGLKYLRFENFDATNGPDLKVYLSNDLDANDYTSLGALKGNIGNQNYEVTNINYGDYDYVLIWCEAFHVLFGYAKIQ